MRVQTPVLVTGANGMLGWELVRWFRADFGEPNVIAADRALIDVANPKSIADAFKKYRPKLVVNAAAYTNVDGAEKEKEKAFAANGAGSQNLADACRKYDAKFVHFSTDQVFDGKTKTPRTEEEPTSPANVYAASKLAGEKAALSNPTSLVLRVQWLYGEKKDRFTPLRDKQVFTPFGDQFGAPAWTLKIAQTVSKLVEREASGLFHFAYDDYASWAEVFGFVKDELGLSVRLEPKTTAEMNLPANRPLFSVLSNRKLCGALGVASLGSWKDPLREFLNVVSR